MDFDENGNEKEARKILNEMESMGVVSPKEKLFLSEYLQLVGAALESIPKNCVVDRISALFSMMAVVSLRVNDVSKLQEGREASVIRTAGSSSSISSSMISTLLPAASNFEDKIIKIETRQGFSFRGRVTIVDIRNAFASLQRNVLEVFTSESARNRGEQPTIIVVLNPSTHIFDSISSNHPLSFDIVTQRQIFRFRALDAQSKIHWVAALTRAAYSPSIHGYSVFEYTHPKNIFNRLLDKMLPQKPPIQADEPLLGIKSFEEIQTAMDSSKQNSNAISSLTKNHDEKIDATRLTLKDDKVTELFFASNDVETLSNEGYFLKASYNPLSDEGNQNQNKAVQRLSRSISSMRFSKKGDFPIGVNLTFNKRYFLLRRNVIFYFTSKNDVAKKIPSGHLFLNELSFVRKLNANSFEVGSLTHRTLVLKLVEGDNADLINNWVSKASKTQTRAAKFSSLYITAFRDVEAMSPHHSIMKTTSENSNSSPSPQIREKISQESFSSPVAETSNTATATNASVEKAATPKKDAVKVVDSEETITKNTENSSKQGTTEEKETIQVKMNQNDEKKMEDPTEDISIKIKIDIIDEAPKERKITNIGSVEAKIHDSLTTIRDKIYKQVEDAIIPIKFLFSRVSDESGVEKFPQILEDQMTLFSFLGLKDNKIDSKQEYSLTIVSNISSSLSLNKFDQVDITPWIREVRSLEAQIAELKRMLNAAINDKTKDDIAAILKRSPLYQVLNKMQVDGYIAEDASIDKLEAEYFSLFSEKDIANLFLVGNDENPLHYFFREKVMNPKSIKNFLSSFEQNVLSNFKINKQRLKFPYWRQLFRDKKFTSLEPEAIAVWASKQPWCENDEEKYIFLSNKVHPKNENKSAYILIEDVAATGNDQNSSIALDHSSSNNSKSSTNSKKGGDDSAEKKDAEDMKRKLDDVDSSKQPQENNTAVERALNDIDSTELVMLLNKKGKGKCDCF